MGDDDNGAMSSSPSLTGAVRLAHLGLIRASGADAAKFLHSQLTSDFSMLGLSESRLAGFCSAKGRLQANFLAWKTSHEEVMLACAASVLAATQKRLSMFVLRLQCKLSDASVEQPLWGHVGASALAHAGSLAPWGKANDANGAVTLRLPDVEGTARCIRMGAAPGDAECSGLSLEAWRWLEVRSGIGWVEAATADQFVPQMLNLELLGGVDFKKGCYPGQEVVARSQYRGTLKRRMQLFTTSGAAAAGQEVFHSADPGQPAGMVVNAASRADGTGMDALVEVKLAALSDGSLHLGSPQGPVLRQEALPYLLPDAADQPA
jgi:tRNA-modifying protein YgfZ